VREVWALRDLYRYRTSPYLSFLPFITSVFPTLTYFHFVLQKKLDQTSYTKDGFKTSHELLSDTTSCTFAHSSKDFKHSVPSDLIYCVAYDTSSSSPFPTLDTSRLFSSPDFFETKQIEEMDIGKNARGVVAFAVVSKFGVVAMRDMSNGGGGGSHGEMVLYVTVDAVEWHRAEFPHASNAILKENAYTVVESMSHSLAVDVVTQDQTSIGTLFVSNSNGRYFVESLKDTNRNADGFVDYEKVYGVDGFGISNVVRNAEEVRTLGRPKQLQSRMTYDDRRSWKPIAAPSKDMDGQSFGCTPKDHDDEECSLHLHSVMDAHNFGRVFSSPAPGFVMGVGNVGKFLLPYDQCSTFLSTDGGLTWKHVLQGPAKYEFLDSGSVLVLLPDSDRGTKATREIVYSLDMGKSWKKYEFIIGIGMIPIAITAVPDLTSQKLIVVGEVDKGDPGEENRVGVVQIDFSGMRKKQCRDGDFEKWYARDRRESARECVLGHTVSLLSFVCEGSINISYP
jgi:hypothetical protein